MSGSYVLLEEEGHERPWQIVRVEDKHVLFTFVKSDRAFATSIFNRLTGVTSLSPDTDDLAISA